MANKIIPYRRDLKVKARVLRKNQTPAEIQLWAAIRKRQLGVEFHRQIPMLDYIVDFYCHEIGLAIELDGEYHETQFFADALRQERLEKQGVHFLRFSNQQIFRSIDEVLDGVNVRITECLA